MSNMDLLTKQIQEDKGYAWSWHCNISMPIYDELKASGIPHEIAHKVSNNAAANFMKIVFDVDIDWKDLLKRGKR